MWATRGWLPDGGPSAKRGPPLLHEAGAVGQRDGLDAVAQTELREDVIDVGLHRRLAQEQRLSDLGVRAPVRDLAQHVELAGAEVRQLRWRPAAARRAL